FSSRRRHTSCYRDWSSDVCSSDLLSWTHYANKLKRKRVKPPGFAAVIREILQEKRLRKVFVPGSFAHGLARELRRLRVKVKVREIGRRRVGKEGSSRRLTERDHRQ